MNRKVKSIVNAAVAMGFGKASDYHGNSIAEVLAEFAAIASGAPKLPAATADDAGKIPTVDENGGYALAEAGGGANILRLYASSRNYSEQTKMLYKNADRTETFSGFMEAYNAIKNADSIIVVFPTENGIEHYSVATFAYTRSIRDRWEVYVIAQVPTYVDSISGQTITVENKQFTLWYQYNHD